ncbi:hypothetical protein APHAL10511_007667 [Amanita phalloides]|nr:hypothetical protein APHAL10511_007667 [Amanita phalloides]
MKSLLFTLYLFALAIPSESTALPSISTRGEASTSNSYGAVYLMTNEPDGNYVIASQIGADGKLTSQQAIPTLGRGAHGMIYPITPDALFTQGAIEISSMGVLAAVNAGSDTISAFSVSESDPISLQRLGSPVWSKGEFPASIAFNRKGDVLCVLNTGFVNGVSCFKVDKTEGLTYIPNTTRHLNLNITTPPTLLGSASQVIFSEDNKLLIAAIKGTVTNAGFLAIWDVYPNYSLSHGFRRVALSSGAFLPFSLTVIPGQNALLAADPAMGYDIFSGISASKKSVGISAYQIPGQNATCWSTYSSKTGNYYLTDPVESRIMEVSIGQHLKSTIVHYYSIGANTVFLDIAATSVNDRGFLYVLSAATKVAVEVFSLDGPGKAKHIQSQDITTHAKAAGIKIDPNNVIGMATFPRF